MTFNQSQTVHSINCQEFLYYAMLENVSSNFLDLNASKFLTFSFCSGRRIKAMSNYYLNAGWYLARLSAALIYFKNFWVSGKYKSVFQLAPLQKNIPWQIKILDMFSSLLQQQSVIKADLELSSTKPSSFICDIFKYLCNKVI